MPSNFLNRERIEQEVKEDFGSAWKSLNNEVKEQLIAGRKSRLLKKYKKVRTMGEAVEEVRRGQSQLYIGIVLGLMGGLAGAVMDRWFGGSIIYDVLAVGFFVGLIITVHYSYNSLVKEMFSFTVSQKLETDDNVKDKE